jgi:hypothetical protein
MQLLAIVVVLIIGTLIHHVQSRCTALAPLVEFHYWKHLPTEFLFTTYSLERIQPNGWLSVGIRDKLSNVTDMYFVKTNPHLTKTDRRIFYMRIQYEQEEDIAGMFMNKTFETSVIPGARVVLALEPPYQLISFGGLKLEQFKSNTTKQIIMLRNFDQKYVSSDTVFRNASIALSADFDPLDKSRTAVCQNQNGTSISYTDLFYHDARTVTSMRLLIAYIVLIVIQLVSLIIWYSLRKRVVVRSRSIIPVICIIFDLVTCSILAITLIIFRVKFRNKQTLEFTQFIYWYTIVFYLAMILKAMTYVLLSILYGLSILRYFVIRNAYTLIRKQSRIFSITSNKLFTVYRILGSKWILYLVSSSLAIMYSVVIISVSVGNRSVHFFESSKSSFIIIPMYLSTLYGLLAIFGLLLDTILNWRIILNNGNIIMGFVKYIRADPLYIRLEMVICGITIIVQLSLVITYQILIRKNVKAISFLIIFQFMCLVIGPVFFYGLFPSGIEIWRIFIQWIKPGKQKYASNVNQLDRVESALADPESLRLMKDYAAREFSSENIVLWELLWKYKLRGGMKLRRTRKIYDLFISSNSAMEVNVPSKTRKQLSQLLDNTSYDEEYNIPFDQFSALYRDVLANISETFSRFCSTAEYKAKEFEKYLLENEYMMDSQTITSHYVPMNNKE